MPRYTPIDLGRTIDAEYARFLSARWVEDRILDLDFGLKEGGYLHVQFEGEMIIRLLDEFALSNEDDHQTDREGMVAHHFAYRVKDHPFFFAQADVWLEIAKPTHYQFVTAWGCIDVLSSNPPLHRFTKEMRAEA